MVYKTQRIIMQNVKHFLGEFFDESSFLQLQSKFINSSYSKEKVKSFVNNGINYKTKIQWAKSQI